jgi:methionyl-tRNA formyltransferase
MLITNEKLPRTPQKIEDGITYTKKDTLKFETIKEGDSEDLIDRKIRAFWFPPFTAKITLNGKVYPLVNQEMIDAFVAK